MATTLRNNKEVAPLLVSVKGLKEGYRIIQIFPAFLLQQSYWRRPSFTTHFHDYRSCYELWSVRDAESPLPPNGNLPVLMQVIDRWIFVGFTVLGGFEKIQLRVGKKQNFFWSFPHKSKLWGQKYRMKQKSNSAAELLQKTQKEYILCCKF